jgi:L-2,4-diaminobutyric acid acetyltransferase
VPSDIAIRCPREEEFVKVHRLVCQCPPLETYGVHFYRIALRYFGSTFFVAEVDSEMVGLTWGCFYQEFPVVFFLWQIGVRPINRGQGIAQLLLRHMERQMQAFGRREIQLTVDPENAASIALFENAGFRNASDDEGRPQLQVGGRTALKDHYGPGRHFILYQKAIPKSVEDTVEIHGKGGPRND